MSSGDENGNGNKNKNGDGDGDGNGDEDRDEGEGGGNEELNEVMQEDQELVSTKEATNENITNELSELLQAAGDHPDRVCLPDELVRDDLNPTGPTMKACCDLSISGWQSTLDSIVSYTK